MRDGDIATLMQQQEDDQAHKWTEKEQLVMTSMPTGKCLLLFKHFLSLQHILQYSIPHNFGVASKVTTLEMDSIFFFADSLLHLQAVFKLARKIHCGCGVSLHKLVITRYDLHQYIDEPQIKDHQ